MTLVLDVATLKENLYVTNLKISFPQKSINIDAKDLIDDDIAETWGTDGARVSFSLNISKKINEFIDRFTVARRNIIGRLMFDDNNFLLFESGLNDFLVDCKQLDDDFVEALEEILNDWENVEDDFQFSLSEKMRVALTKSFTSHNKTTIDEQVEKSVEIYMTRKFPTAESVRDKCAVIYDTPRLFKQAAPKGLSPEAAAAYEKSQQENLKLIYDLLVKDYLSLELDVCVGFLEKLVSLPRLFHPKINELVKGEIDFSEDETSQDFDLNLGEKKKQSSEDIELQSRLSELKNSDGVRKYNVNTYKKLQGRSKSLAENLANSITMLAKVIDALKLDDMGVMLENCKTFYSWCEEWLKDYEVSGKKSKKLLIVPETRENNSTPISTNDSTETIEFVEVDKILASELENNVVFLSEIKREPKTPQITEDTKIEIDKVREDFDLAI